MLRSNSSLDGEASWLSLVCPKEQSDPVDGSSKLEEQLSDLLIGYSSIATAVKMGRRGRWPLLCTSSFICLIYVELHWSISLLKLSSRSSQPSGMF